MEDNNIEILKEKLKKYNTTDNEYRNIYNKIYHLKNKNKISENKKQNIELLIKERTKCHSATAEYIKLSNQIYYLQNREKHIKKQIENRSKRKNNTKINYNTIHELQYKQHNKLINNIHTKQTKPINYNIIYELLYKQQNKIINNIKKETIINYNIIYELQYKQQQKTNYYTNSYKKFYKNHKQKILEDRKMYYQKNKEKIKEYQNNQYVKKPARPKLSDEEKKINFKKSVKKWQTQKLKCKYCNKSVSYVYKNTHLKKYCVEKRIFDKQNKDNSKSI